ncbi:MAG: response regulator [Gammaproteobacteria bacterium]|jgi:signal transduction histidine kinase/CheY-like chemotaxis protein/HPt (histidine-containing phosphotransfer) domain-containing protein|nr:response regulator [Gammaproteobacteria bacterium]MBT4606867.1 response regulator [Thiotrichales bacterium]MBT3967406.1 response regulator [Gammaproteobacteria bacterium]MBT4812239.1 response regulator [Thiotrichales bacterium]MBT5746160.1 response regulator [Gammaproteobacteria bacterium]
MKQSSSTWSHSLLLRVLLPLLLVVSGTSFATFIYSEQLLERVILDQVRKQAEVFLIGLERQIQEFKHPFDRSQLETLFQQVLSENEPRYSFSIKEIYLYRDTGEVVAHSDQMGHLPKDMRGKYGEVLQSGNSYLHGAVEESGGIVGPLIRSTDIIIPLSIHGRNSAALEAELDITKTQLIITSIDDQFESMMRIVTLFSVLITSALIILMVWTQLIRPARSYQNTLQESVKEGQALNRAKDDFLSSMSHELRTPLSTIIGYQQILVEADDLKYQYKEMIRDSLLAGQTLQQLVNDLLDMSKIRSGKFELSPHAFNLQQAIEDVSRLMQSYSPEKGISIQLHIDKKTKPLLTHQWIGDDIRLSQILFNLLSNAIKFSPNESIITLSVAQAKQPVQQTDDASTQWFEISVADHGIGMSEAVQKRLFTPFEQADSSTSRRFGGTGLGLYISQQLAQMMGGDININSAINMGSTFNFVLPLNSSAKAALSQSIDIEEYHSSIPQLQGRVLLAEDTIPLQRLTRIMIERYGATVEVAADGVEAVEKATHNEYQLIFMDMQMPHMDGIEATHTLRNAGCTTPIIALTANVMPKHQEAFQDAGCNDFLSKPVNPAHLYTRLTEHLSTTVTNSETVEFTQSDEWPAFVISEEMMQDFWEDLQEMRATLGIQYQKESWQDLYNIAHAIKGIGSSFGHPEISKLAAQLEESIRIDNIEQITERYTVLSLRLQQVNPLESCDQNKEP